MNAKVRNLYIISKIGLYFIIVLLLTLPDVRHYSCLMQIHVYQDNKHELFAYAYVQFLLILVLTGIPL